MHELEELSLYRLKQYYGLMTSEEALDGAIASEQATLISEGTSFQSTFKRNADRLFTYSLLLEKKAEETPSSPSKS